MTKTTNVEIAGRLGMTPSGISRLRSGDRRPSFALMGQIATEFGWPVSEQAQALDMGNWVDDFNTIVETR